MPSAIQSSTLPVYYRLFFLIIEPISALAGAYMAYFQPTNYLTLTTPLSPSPADLPLSTNIVLTQLANLYLLFAINEALVLRSTSDMKVWKTVLLGLLIADFGHLYSVKALGFSGYWKVWEWNAMAWGNVGFVYAGALTRICFLFNVGLRGERRNLAASKMK
jgi:hypothetical protein